jgi:rSAM/selenodomain-associated transferase 1
MGTAALGIVCKAPRPGASKTRLASLIGAERAAALAACFLRDVAAAIELVPERLGRMGYGVYAPAGAERELRGLLPVSFGLMLQADVDLGIVLRNAVRQLLSAGHDCVVLVNADSPTLPPALLSQTMAMLRRPGDRVVLGPAIDGGYCFIGLKAAHDHLFQAIPWSTGDVFRLTCERARDIALPLTVLPVWYDVDDAETFSYLERELAGTPPPFAAAGLVGGPAVATRALLQSFRAERGFAGRTGVAETT